MRIEVNSGRATCTSSTAAHIAARDFPAEQRARTRAELIDAAGVVFASRGLEATIDDIAAEAGFTKGAFYANFASKEEIFLEVVDRRFEIEATRLGELLAGDEDPEGQARAAAIDFVRFVSADPAWPRLFFEFTVRAVREPAFREHLAGRYDTLRARLTEVYERWTAELGVVSPIPLEQVATMTYCMANGFLAERLIDPAIDEEVFGSMMAVFIRGLQGMAEDQAEPGDFVPAIRQDQGA
jgi:AcrR family transcriptional regulator